MRKYALLPLHEGERKAMKKPQFDLMKVYKDRAKAIRAYSKRERRDLQDALDDVIVAGLKVKRLMPQTQDRQEPGQVQG